jgi:hypothetical protein
MVTERICTLVLDVEMILLLSLQEHSHGGLTKSDLSGIAMAIQLLAEAANLRIGVTTLSVYGNLLQELGVLSLNVDPVSS